MPERSSSYQKESLLLHNILNTKSSSSQIALLKIIREATITQIKIKLKKLVFFIFEVSYWGSLSYFARKPLSLNTGLYYSPNIGIIKEIQL